nr:NADH-quinone oxidoreductase subunit K [Sphingomonas jejuensis]
MVGAGVVGCALHMMLSRNLVRLLLGVSLLSTGVNILLFVAGGMGNRQPPLIRAGETQLGDSADPLTQALILTAIVIGFALTVVFAAFVLRAWRTERTVDGRAVDAAERLGLPRQEDDA